MRTKEEIAFAFTPVVKLGVTQQQLLLRTQILFKDTATELADLIPDSADKTDAMRKLLEAKFMFIQALTHDRTPATISKEKMIANGQTKAVN